MNDHRTGWPNPAPLTLLPGPGVLHHRRLDGVTITEALDTFGAGAGDRPNAAICWSHRQLWFTRVIAHGLAAVPDADLPEMFELRAFDEHAELRWLRTPGEGTHGAAVLLSEDAHRAGGEAVPYRDRVAGGSQLLFGEVYERHADRHVTLTAERLRALTVPVTTGAAAGRRARIRTIEYLDPDPRHDGAARVVAERLTGIELVDPAPNGAGDDRG